MPVGQREGRAAPSTRRCCKVASAQERGIGSRALSYSLRAPCVEDDVEILSGDVDRSDIPARRRHGPEWKASSATRRKTPVSEAGGTHRMSR